MDQSIKLLQNQLRTARAQAQYLRELSAQHGEVAPGGPIRWDKEAAKLEALAADYRQALAHLLRRAASDAQQQAAALQQEVYKLAQTTPSTDSLATQQQLQRDATAQRCLASAHTATLHQLLLDTDTTTEGA